MTNSSRTTAPLITRTLSGGTSYELRASPPVPAVKIIFSTAVSVLLLPLSVPFGLLWATAMATPLRSTLISMFIPKVMDTVDKEFHKERGKLLSGISGRVLDVGSGGGAYMQYFSKDSGVDQVVAVEPCQPMHPLIRGAAEKSSISASSLKIVNHLEDLKEDVEKESFDWIILGNVLCEVDDVPATVELVSRLLKPGGKVYFQEHVARRAGSWQRKIQNFINPAWRHVGGGCNCNRDSVDILKQHPCWEDVIEWQYDHQTVCMGPMVLGLAQKKSSAK